MVGKDDAEVMAGAYTAAGQTTEDSFLATVQGGGDVSYTSADAFTAVGRVDETELSVEGTRATGDAFTAVARASDPEPFPPEAPT